MFKQVTIVGVGLLGASLGLALKERRLAQRVVGVGRSESASLQTALTRGAIDAAGTDVAAGVVGSDLVVICTPVRQFPKILAAMRGTLEPGAVVTDVGSTKQQVMAWAKAAVAKEVRFVGSHPMAGSEKRGPEAARADLFEGALCLLCAEEEETAKEGGPKAEDAVEQITRLWEAVGMRTLRLTPAEHDRWVANVSHLPHAAAFALMQTALAAPETLAAAAGGFLDTTRVASSDVDMWTDVFLTNAPAIHEALTRYITVLDHLRSAVARGDEASLRELLAGAKQARDDLLTRRQERPKAQQAEGGH